MSLKKIFIGFEKYFNFKKLTVAPLEALEEAGALAAFVLSRSISRRSF